MRASRTLPASTSASVTVLTALVIIGSTTKRKSSYNPVWWRAATTLANWFVGALTIKSPYADNLAVALNRETSRLTYADCARAKTSSCTPRLSAAAIWMACCSSKVMLFTTLYTVIIKTSAFLTCMCVAWYCADVKDCATPFASSTMWSTNASIAVLRTTLSVFEAAIAAESAAATLCIAATIDVTAVAADLAESTE